MYILILCIEEEAILKNIGIRGPALALLLLDEMNITGNPVIMVEGKARMNPTHLKVKQVNQPIGISHSKQVKPSFLKQVPTIMPIQDVVLIVIMMVRMIKDMGMILYHTDSIGRTR